MQAERVGFERCALYFTKPPIVKSEIYRTEVVQHKIQHRFLAVENDASRIKNAPEFAAFSSSMNNRHTLSKILLLYNTMFHLLPPMKLNREDVPSGGG